MIIIKALAPKKHANTSGLNKCMFALFRGNVTLGDDASRRDSKMWMLKENCCDTTFLIERSGIERDLGRRFVERFEIS